MIEYAYHFQGGHIEPKYRLDMIFGIIWLGF